MGLLLSILLGFVPMFFFAWLVYWLDRYEKEPLGLLAAIFIWGAVVAAGGAFLLNSLFGMGVYLFTASDAATSLATGVVSAPLVEESLKGLAVLLVFLAFRHEFDSILDGIVYAAIVALGFAATENAFYIYNYGYLEEGMDGLLFIAFVRIILVGWQHPFYTAFIGIGLAVVRRNRSLLLKLIVLITGWFAAIFTHAVHNTIAEIGSGPGGLVFGTALDWTGWSLMFLVILWAIAQEKNGIRRHLREEVLLGNLSEDQYRIASSAWSQSRARFGALFSGRYQTTNSFYQTCAELAHKKQHLESLGEEYGNSAIIEQLRSTLRRLSEAI